MGTKSWCCLRQVIAMDGSLAIRSPTEAGAKSACIGVAGARSKSELVKGTASGLVMWCSCCGASVVDGGSL